MRKIKLHNRDGANLYLEQIDDSDIYKMSIDESHDYCLKYMRMGGDFEVQDNKIIWNKVVMMDPSGGPYLEVGDIIDNKYEIVEMFDDLTMKLHERHPNK